MELMELFARKNIISVVIVVNFNGGSRTFQMGSPITKEDCNLLLLAPFKVNFIDYFRGHIVFWETFGRFMLIRTK